MVLLSLEAGLLIAEITIIINLSDCASQLSIKREIGINTRQYTTPHIPRVIAAVVIASLMIAIAFLSTFSTIDPEIFWNYIKDFSTTTIFPKNDYLEVSGIIPLLSSVPLGLPFLLILFASIYFSCIVKRRKYISAILAGTGYTVVVGLYIFTLMLTNDIYTALTHTYRPDWLYKVINISAVLVGLLPVVAFFYKPQIAIKNLEKSDSRKVVILGCVIILVIYAVIIGIISIGIPNYRSRHS
jgi:hypothetical protein